MLKECALLAGIKAPLTLVSYKGSKREVETVPKWKAVTTHCARRTFVVNSLRLGIPAEVIMKWTGHSDFTAMKPYVAIVDELKKENMAKYATLYENEKKFFQLKKKSYFCKLIGVRSSRVHVPTLYPLLTNKLQLNETE